MMADGTAGEGGAQGMTGAPGASGTAGTAGTAGLSGMVGTPDTAAVSAAPAQPAAEHEPRGEISFFRVGFLVLFVASEMIHLYNDTSTYQKLWQELLSCESANCMLAPVSVITNMLNKDAFIVFLLLFALFEPITCVRRALRIIGCYLFPFAGQFLLFNKRSLRYMIACVLFFMAATFVNKHFLTTLICSGALSACLMLVRHTILREESRDHVSVRQALRSLLSREAKDAPAA